MKIRKMAELYALYPQTQEGLMYDSPELLMMRYISENNTDGVMALFPEKRQFSDAPPAVDTPYGRFEGKEKHVRGKGNWTPLVGRTPEGAICYTGGRKAYYEENFRTFSLGRDARRALRNGALV